MSLLLYSDSLFRIWILVFPICIIEVSTPRIWSFLIYFSSIHDFWNPRTWKSLIIHRGAKWSDVNNVLFSSLKCEKKIIWNIKPSAWQTFYWQLGLREWRVILPLRYEHITVKHLHYFKRSNENLEIFCLHVTGYVNTKKSIPNCIFLLMISWNCAHHIYFSFLQDI